MANKIQIRRGLKTNLPSLDVGEPALCTDTREVYIGNTGENVQLVSKEMLNGILGNYTLQIPYAVAEGSANSYAVTLSPAMKTYVEGVAVAVKINVTNTAASTINICGLGVKSIVDSKGNAVTAGKLVANSICTLRYNGTNFILQGEGGAYGNVTKNDVLSSAVFGTENGLVAGAIPLKLSQTYNPSTTAQTIAAGLYLSGAQTINPVTGTATAADVANGKTFSSANGINLTGTNTNKKWASGTNVYSAANTYMNFLSYGSYLSRPYITVSGLSFLPSLIEIQMIHSSVKSKGLYSTYDVYETAYNSQYLMNINTGQSFTPFQVTGNAYVTSGGFQLPVPYEAMPYNWRAFE